MWKYPLLALICVPLGLIAAREVQTYLDEDRPRANIPSTDRDKKTAETEGGNKASVPVPDEDLCLAVFRGSVAPPRSGSKRPAELQPLASQILAHAEKIEDAVRLANNWVKLERNSEPSEPCRDPEYNKWLADHKKAVEGGLKREKELAAGGDSELSAILGEFRERLSMDKPGPLDDLVAKLRRLVGELEKLRQDCRDFPALRKAVQGHIGRAEAYRALAELVMSDQAVLVPTDKTADKNNPALVQLKKYAGLLKEYRSEEFRDFASLLRRHVRRFCEAYLPQSEKPAGTVRLDDVIRDRDTVVIQLWEDTPEHKDYPPNGRVALDKMGSNYDEFNLKAVKAVKYYAAGGTTFTRIGPSPAGAAIRYYNANRPGLRFTEESLKRLKEGMAEASEKVMAELAQGVQQREREKQAKEPTEIVRRVREICVAVGDAREGCPELFRE